VTMDRILAQAAQPEAALAEAARTLRAGGRLCLVEDFDALADRDSNPLGVMREWLSKAKFECQRINPVDTDGAHLLVVIARARSLAQRAA
jgi:ubiquinone/menaquinone biosynthesis C-methylase UbiE